MYSNAELKSMAKAQIKGNIGILFVINLLIGLISYTISLLLSLIPFIGSLLSVFLVIPFTISQIRIYQTLANYNQPPTLNDMFSGFDCMWPAFCTAFLVGLYTFLWSLLFIIPGIIKSYSYSQAMYILAENKDIPPSVAINQSREMMDGRKMDLFMLQLSFIGWFFLVCITFGIAGIWVGPYYNAAMVNFYNNCKPATVTYNSNM